MWAVVAAFTKWETPDCLDWKIWRRSPLFNWLKDFTWMRQSILVGAPVGTSTPDDVLVAVHNNPVQSDWWWASPSRAWSVGTVSKSTTTTTKWLVCFHTVRYIICCCEGWIFLHSSTRPADGFLFMLDGIKGWKQVAAVVEVKYEDFFWTGAKMSFFTKGNITATFLQGLARIKPWSRLHSPPTPHTHTLMQGRPDQSLSCFHIHLSFSIFFLIDVWGGKGGHDRWLHRCSWAGWFWPSNFNPNEELNLESNKSLYLIPCNGSILCFL